MKNKKSAASSMILGVAFVWFTTHFGGGFASGAQIYSLCDVRGSRSCICDRRSDFKYPDRTSVSAVYVDYRHIYLRCGSIWNRPGV